MTDTMREKEELAITDKIVALAKKLVTFIDNEGPCATAWEPISETTKALAAAIEASAPPSPELPAGGRTMLDPLDMLLDAARFIERDKPGWAKSARDAVARAQLAPHNDVCDILKPYLDAADRHAEGLNAQLHKPEWRPSRAHIEQARNTIRNLAGKVRAALPAPAPHAEPGAFLNDGTKIRPTQLHPFYDQPEDDQAVAPAPHAEVRAEPITFIDTRLEDLAEANAIYGKDQRLGAPDKIARNDREISWLKDLRSLILTAALPQSERGEVE